MISSGYTQKLKGDDMALLRRPESLQAIKDAYQQHGADMLMRTYHLPEYQRIMIDILAKDSGLSKAGVMRQIIDEWYESNVESKE
jgi:methionine synthase I (cobalamin-dependent)